MYVNWQKYNETWYSYLNFPVLKLAPIIRKIRFIQLSRGNYLKITTHSLRWLNKRIRTLLKTETCQKLGKHDSGVWSKYSFPSISCQLFPPLLRYSSNASSFDRFISDKNIKLDVLARSPLLIYQHNLCITLEAGSSIQTTKHYFEGHV